MRTRATTSPDLASLRNRLLEERQRLEELLCEVERALGKRPSANSQQSARRSIAPPDASPLDSVRELVKATEDMRVNNGNLSAQAVADVFGISLSQLAGWMGRSRQALAKTPDADSLQNELSFFERVARLRAVLPPERFSKWLRMPNRQLDGKTPIQLMADGEQQVVVDFVEDMLTGAPS